MVQATLASDRVARTRSSVARWCRTAETAHELLEGLSVRLCPVIEHDASAWLVTDPATILFTDGFVDGFPAEVCAPFFHNQLSVPDVMKFSELAGRRDPAATLFAETGGKMHDSALWRDVYEPFDLDDELRSVFRDPHGTWGVVALTRAKGRPRFSEEERGLVSAIGEDVARALRRITLRWAAETDAPDGPGLVLVRSNGEVHPATEAGARWLDRIVSPSDHGEQRTALLALHALVTGGHPERRVPLRTRDGAWVTLHAEPMLDADGTLAVIIEPSHPAHIAGVIALAHGLSSREREVALAVARGLGTDEIADELHISTHTVRDHLKKAFAKTGVGSRAELVGALFHEHYADRLFGSAEVRNH